MGLYQASRMFTYFSMSEMYGYSSSEKVSGRNIADLHVILVEVNGVLKTEVNDSTETIRSSVYFWFSITIALPCPAQGIFPTQRSSPGLLRLLHCRRILYQCHLGSPKQKVHIFTFHRISIHFDIPRYIQNQEASLFK